METVLVAFAMFSAIPLPQVEWNGRNMRYALCAFPLVGAVCAALWWGWAWVCAFFAAPELLRGAGFCLIPVLVTGGIHLDGFCDTMDALASHAPREKKLAILKDSNAGAFAVIWCCVWFLLCFGLLTELDSAATVAPCFVLSRCLSALGVERLPSARPMSGPQAGMGASLKKSSRFPWWVLAVYLALWAGAVWLWGEPVPALAALAAAVGVYFIYRAVALGQFGGFTGDLAGWFLQICELAMLAAAVLAERVVAVWF